MTIMSTDLTPTQRRFLLRVNLTCAWGEGVDGFDLGILSTVLAIITIELGMSPVETGLAAAASLIGIFFGAPIVGLLTDRFGRKVLFTVDLILFVVFGVLQAVVTEPWQLIVVRLLLGFTIGAEYSLGGAMLAEFVPAHGRGTRIAAMIVCWYVGFLLAVIVGFAMLSAGLSWRWVLATSALPAIATLIMRIGIPESPRWLMHNGQDEEAKAIVDRFLGPAYFHAEGVDAEQHRPSGLREVLRGDNGRRLLFCSVLWAANVGPFFAIFTFAPTVLEALKIQNETAGTLVLNGFATIGAIIGMLLLERVGRRMQTLAVVYPSEIMPTEVRGTGIGIAAAVSRLSAAAGTFLLPIWLDSIGIGPSMLIFAVVLLIGGIYSWFEAPETTGINLAEVSHGKIHDAPHHVDHATHTAVP